MKSSIRLTIIVLFSAIVTTVRAADIITLTTGSTRTGTVVDVADGNLRLKDGPITATIPLAQIKSVMMPAPAEYHAVIAMWREGDVPKTLALLEPLIKKFQGLPAPWMERASILLGEVKLAGGDVEGASRVFADFQKTYPDSTEMAEVALARLALEKGDLDAARDKAGAVADEARRELSAGPEKSAQFAQALLVMGGVIEKDEELENALSKALDNYMLIITVFNHDPAIVMQAKARAKALQQQGITVP